jgi:hypothetical protein
MLKKKRKAAPAPAPATAMMTEEDFNAFNDSLSDEDKELQAALLMWCIVNSAPYTLALFEKYKRNVQLLKQEGLI